MRKHISIFTFLLCAFAAVGTAGASTTTAGFPYYTQSGTTGSDVNVVYSTDGVNYIAIPPAGRKVGNWGWANDGSEAQQYKKVNWEDPAKTGTTYAVPSEKKAAVYFAYIPLTVSFNGNGGSGSMNPIEDLNYDSEITLPANAFTKKGCHFIGWRTNSTEGIVFEDKAELTGADLWNGTGFNSTFFAQWEADGTIILDNHGADLEKGTASVAVAPGNPLPKISVPRKTGNDFNGYFEKEDGKGEQYWYKNGTGLVDDWQGLGVTTAHASWVAHEYKIVYSNLGDASAYPKEAKYGDEIMLSAPVQGGLTFAGWNIAAGLKSSHAEWHQSEKDWSKISTTYQRLQADGDNHVKTIWLRNLNTNNLETVTINANWTTNSYKINLTFEGAINTPTPYVDVDYGAIPKGIPIVPDYGSGMVFTGYVDSQGRLWYGADGKLTTEFADYHWDRTEDLELTAQKGGIEYYITYDANAKHGGIGMEPQQTCNTANEVTLSSGSNMSNPYHSLAGWSKNQDTLPGDVIGTNLVPGGHPSYSELGVTKDKTEITLYAIWRDRRVTIGIDAAGGKAFTNGVEVTEIVYVDGEKYGFLPTAERPKYKFDGWYSAATGGTLIEPDMIVSKADVPVLYAHWSPEKFYVRFDGNGASNETEMAVQEFLFNEEKPLLPNEYGRVGYDFTGWTTNATDKTKVYEDGQVVSNLTETVGATNVLYALWDAHHYTITFDANGGKGENPKDMNCTYGEEVSLPTPSYVPPKNYATFIGWSTNKSDTVGVYTVSNLTAEAGGIVTVYAVWEYDVGPWSDVLDCDNLKFENVNGAYPWTVEDDGAVTGSDKCLTHKGDGSAQGYGRVYAELDESGTLTYWWKGEGDGDPHEFWVCLTETGNWTEDVAKETSIDSHDVRQSQGWTKSTVKITVPAGEKRYIWFAHNASIPVSIDCVTWTPDGGGEPTPGEAVAVTAAGVEGNVFSLTIQTDEIGKDYGVWTNADLTVDSWGLMGEPQKGEGQPIEFKWTILPGFPQLFFRAHKVVYE